LSPLHTGSKPLFFFFSNRLGCFGSIALSVVLTLILIALIRWMSL
jgi:hypothetical protein